MIVTDSHNDVTVDEYQQHTLAVWLRFSNKTTVHINTGQNKQLVLT